MRPLIVAGLALAFAAAPVGAAAPPGDFIVVLRGSAVQTADGSLGRSALRSVISDHRLSVRHSVKVLAVKKLPTGAKVTIVKKKVHISLPSALAAGEYVGSIRVSDGEFTRVSKVKLIKDNGRRGSLGG